MEVGLVVGWLALYLLLARAGQPLAARLLPWHGAEFALPVALTVLWLVVFWTGRLALGPAVWLGALLVVALGAVLDWRAGADPVPDGYLETAAVFAAGFLFVVAVRAVDPAVVPGGGEKFLDFGLLKSLLRAEALPAEDMWFAGEPVSYYYGGHLLAASLARLTGTAGRFAYNLALAGYYAMLVTAVYGLAGRLAAARGAPRRLGAVLGAFLVGLAANVQTPVRLLVWLLPGGEALAGRLGVPIEGAATGPGGFDYWDASRVIRDDPGGFVTYTPRVAPTINEFPLFSWLNGDLHAHMMATTFLVLVAALLYAYASADPARVWRRRGLLAAVSAVGGLLAATSTWSFPTVGGLVAVTLVLAPADPRTLLPRALAGRLAAGSPLGREAVRVGVGLAAGVAVLVVAVGWSLPFWLTSVTAREVTVLPDRSSLAELLLVHGAFLAVFAAYLYARGVDTLGRERARVGALAAVVAVAAAAAADAAALGLIAPLVAVGWLFARRSVASPAPARADGGGARGDSRSEGRAGFETVLLVAGAGLVVLVEFVFVREAVGRMNTVFKTYVQVWVLWSVAAGAMLAWLLSRWRSVGVGRAVGPWRGRALRAGVALLLVSTSLYAGLALTDHFASGADIARTDDPTLDGLAYLDTRHPAEAPAIRWLDAREGRPTIVTAAPGSYFWSPSEGEGASAPASLTGLPTVLGWGHEAQYRGEEPYRERLAHVETIYQGSAGEQAALLERYGVTYVYVGPAERARYRVTIDDRAYVEVARAWEDVTVYRVRL